MSLTGPWVPETEEEKRMMEDIHIATRRAHQDGVSKKRVASLLAFMASAALDPAAEMEPPQGEERTVADEYEERAEQEEEECPECGSEIEDVGAFMGGLLKLLPCGCEFEKEEWEELGDWTEEYESGEGGGFDG